MLYDALPDARLAIIPNTSHLLAMERPDLIAPHVVEFFERPNRQPTMMPIMRAVA
jgi:pimeloyl-ACP methyl ester carboxylesterase